MKNISADRSEQFEINLRRAIQKSFEGLIQKQNAITAEELFTPKMRQQAFAMLGEDILDGGYFTSITAKKKAKALDEIANILSTKKRSSISLLDDSQSIQDDSKKYLVFSNKQRQEIFNSLANQVIDGNYFTAISAEYQAKTIADMLNTVEKLISKLENKTI